MLAPVFFRDWTDEKGAQLTVDPRV